jgi:molybdopterin synthase sulfur carrier subunit
MRVFVPGPLRSYTGNRAEVEGSGATLGEMLSDLEARYPGIRFRMIDEQDGVRQHIRFFVNQEQVTALEAPVGAGDEVHIICAISGGQAGAGNLRHPRASNISAAVRFLADMLR